MFPVNKDTAVIVGIIVCALGILYLYRELQKIKKVPLVRPPQPVPVQPNWVPTPVNDAPAPVPPPAPVPAPVPVEKATEAKTD